MRPPLAVAAPRSALVPRLTGLASDALELLHVRRGERRAVDLEVLDDGLFAAADVVQNEQLQLVHLK